MSRDKQMPKKKETDTASSLLTLIAGFLLIIYGFLNLIQPNNYPLGPSQYAPFFALILMAFGVFLIWKRRKA